MIALRVLAHIEGLLRERSGRPDLVLSDYFDYIGGTSTGGIIAAGLAIGLPVAAIEGFYRTQCQRLFAPTRNPIKQFLYARYDAGPLSAKLKEIFGEHTTLGSCRLKTLLLLVMLNAATSSPWPVSNNPRAKYNDPALGAESNLNLPLWQLVRASAAAPYLFEPEAIQVGRNRFLFYDGALTSMNNPAAKLFQMATAPVYRLGWATGEHRMLLVSVGTGLLPREVPRLGLLDKQVATTIIHAMEALLFAGTAEVDLQCRSLGTVLAGDKIDSEVGDFIGQEPVGLSPLFTYLRYNALLTEKGLRPLGCAELCASTRFRLDDVTSIEACATVGNAIAGQRVKADHFAGFPPTSAVGGAAGWSLGAPEASVERPT